MTSRSHSVLVLIVALAVALVAACQLTAGKSHSFIPAAVVARKVGRQLVIDDVGTAATTAALAAAATAPLPVAALEEDGERFGIRILAVMALPLTAVFAFAGPVSSATINTHWMDHLKFGGSEPSFDVIQKTKEYIAASEKNGGLATSFHADDYMFRGSIVGPITGQDVAETQANFNLLGAYPDIDRGIFGYTVDPQNPYRCFIFERWTGTCTGSIKIGPITLPPTGNRIETPIHVSSIIWNPDGKVVYECISPPIDRFEGNTKGSGAVFGLLAGAGLALPAEVGSPFLMFGQRFNTDLLGGPLGKTWSSEEKVATWWKSKAKGADPTDI